MVNETLEDIFNEFYARETRRHSREAELEDELDDCWIRIGRLEEECASLSEDIYDRNSEIEDLESEIRRLQSKIKEYENAFSKGCPLKS